MSDWEWEIEHARGINKKWKNKSDMEMADKKWK